MTSNGAWTSGRDAAESRFYPPLAPLLMPVQELYFLSGTRARPNTSSSNIAWRRVLIGTCTGGLIAFAAHQMYLVLNIGGLTTIETVVLAVFVILFTWISLACVTAIAGFILTLTGRPAPDLDIEVTSLFGRTAILLPMYNEEPSRVISRFQSIFESVSATNHLESFDFYLLSDTNNPQLWLEEESRFVDFNRSTASQRVFYRHRTRNVARKSGNIAEWIVNHGGRYDYMIVLDADSLMSGDTIVRLVHKMDLQPEVGLIQTLPILINGNTLFARTQQFAHRVYGPVLAAGSAWWHGAESNYWGHNAIIRVRAFADCAGLPALPGEAPFGGHIMSHDFVEAALMRRGGWAIHIDPQLQGSYEECPPTIADFAIRDRRWCQGNLQHLRLLTVRGLCLVSRWHLLSGAMSYICSFLWLIFLLLGISLALQTQFIRPEYFPEKSLFPQWPAQDPIRAISVFVGAMVVLLIPKMLGGLAYLISRPVRRRSGELKPISGMIVETVISGLIAPIMMVFQTRSLIDILGGRDSGWSVQIRDSAAIHLKTMMRAYALPTLIGGMLSFAAYLVSWHLFLWMLPVIVGLVLAVPLAVWTASRALARTLRTPEEIAPPAILTRASELSRAAKKMDLKSLLIKLRSDETMRELHEVTIAQSVYRKPGEYPVDLLVAGAKLSDSETVEEFLSKTSSSELFAALSDRESLRTLIAKPFGRGGRIDIHLSGAVR